MIKNVYVFLWGVKASCIKLIALGVYYGHFLIFSQVALVLLYNLLDLSFFFSKKAFQFSILELLPYTLLCGDMYILFACNLFS
jgi:hypothetical protein